MRKTTVLIVAAAALSGCKTTYYHPFKGTPEFHGDLLQCEAIAGQIAGGYIAVGDPNFVAGAALGHSIRRNQYVDHCLRSRGWVTDPETLSSASPISTYDVPDREDDAQSCHEMADRMAEKDLSDYANRIRASCPPLP